MAFKNTFIQIFNALKEGKTVIVKFIEKQTQKSDDVLIMDRAMILDEVPTDRDTYRIPITTDGLLSARVLKKQARHGSTINIVGKHFNQTTIL